MKNKLLLLFFLVSGTSGVFAQKQGNVWMFGQGGALNFNTTPPTAVWGSQVFSDPSQSGDYLYSEGAASISDSSGNLLFYSNGEKTWNALNNMMPHGDSLKGFYSSTTAAFIIPVPKSDSLYYLFTTDGIERYLQNGLRYSLINMCLDNGKGDVVVNQKNTLLLDTVGEKLCAVVQPNSPNIWLIAHKHFTNSFYAYLITPTGINSPVISSIGSVHTGNMSYYNGCGTAIGQMKASSDGSRIGLAFSNVSPEVAEVFDFNTLTGMINNPISLTSNVGNYGVEFSPDNTKFYLTSVNGIYQFNLSAGPSSAINASKIQITSANCIPGPIQLGPDGKIYAARCSNYLGVINDPNNSGTSCNYVDHGITISPCNNNTSLPVFIAGYHYKNNKKPSCSTTGIDNYFISNEHLIFPNPFSTETTLHSDRFLKDATLTFYNIFGEQVKQLKNISGQSITLQRDNLPSGIYFIRLTQGNKVITTEKLVVID
jgi:hypothetical protein